VTLNTKTFLAPRLKKEWSYNTTPHWAFVTCSKLNLPLLKGLLKRNRKGPTFPVACRSLFHAGTRILDLENPEPLFCTCFPAVCCWDHIESVCVWGTGDWVWQRKRKHCETCHSATVSMDRTEIEPCPLLTVTGDKPPQPSGGPGCCIWGSEHSNSGNSRADYVTARIPVQWRRYSDGVLRYR